MGDGIYQFMWPWQVVLRNSVNSKIRSILKELGIRLEPNVLLIGARRPGKEFSDRNEVCIEPEDGEWKTDMFPALLARIEQVYENHHLHNTIFGDETSMRAKPEWARRDSVRTAIEENLAEFDQKHNVESITSAAIPIGNFYVVAVVQLPKSMFRVFSKLEKPTGLKRDYAFYPTLIHAAIHTVLDVVETEMQLPDPGHSQHIWNRKTEELARDAASTYIEGLVNAVCNSNFHRNMFDQLNVISSLLYEGSPGRGRMYLVEKDNRRIEWIFKLHDPIPTSDTRWARKLLQVSTSDGALVSDGEYIYGLGRLTKPDEATIFDVLDVQFVDRYSWEITCLDEIRVVSRFGTAQLPQHRIEYERFISNFGRVFPSQTFSGGIALWKLILAARTREKGCMIVVAHDAEEEAARLQQQGTRINPTRLTGELLFRVMDIDGTIIVDPELVCHAVGVILDGSAHPDCTPARGSRYNSAVRYINSSEASRLAVVLSEDRTIDVLPLLRPQIRKSQLLNAIARLESAGLDDYHWPRNWLDENRFYINAEQAQRINSALDRLEKLDSDRPNALVIITTRFEPHPDMNDSYFYNETEPTPTSH